MGRPQGPFSAPPPPNGALEFHRDPNYVGTTDPRDLARFFGQEKTHDQLAATRVVTPDELP